MDRILRDTQATVYVTLTGADGAAADATGTPTVAAVRDSDGTTAASGNAVDATGTGVYSFTFTPAQIPEVDLLTVTWTATIGGAASQLFRTQVEIVGGWLCSLEAIQASLPSSVTPTATQLQAARKWAEDWLEQACGVAFRPRYRRETLDGNGTDLVVGQPSVTSVISASVGGTALTGSEISALSIDSLGILYSSAGWTEGRQNVAVAYIHGFSEPPSPVVRAAVKLARYYLLEDPTNYEERATSITTEDATYSFVTAGVRGARTSIPEVNQVIDEYRYISV